MNKLLANFFRRDAKVIDETQRGERMGKMKWEKLLLPTRLGLEDMRLEDKPSRTHYHKDYDRILFSSSFRRLGKKTQVHPLYKNDHIHSRLTHSIEVSSVGRSLGVLCAEHFEKELPLQYSPQTIGQILQAACLGHDIGNPPFGHAGEEAIKSWFRSAEAAAAIEGLTDLEQDDLKNFEGNAQGFRVLTQLEHYPKCGGMRLTYATLASMLKYPWTSRDVRSKNKFCSFQSEQHILERVCTSVGLIKESEYKYCRHPLAYLVEAADDICYSILDLEDAQEMKILSLDEIADILKPLYSPNTPGEGCIQGEISGRRMMSHMRAISIGTAIDGVVAAFKENYEKIMRGEQIGDLIGLCGDTVRKPIQTAKKIAKDKVFKEPRKIELEIGSYTAIGILLNAFCRAVREQVVSGGHVCYKSERILSMMGYNAPQKGHSLYESYLKVTDYISGMTDNYAAHMAKQIGGMGE